ncbi:spermatogenesis-associated protein 17-like isoform X2 [Xenia sp. Carnegie-2017]|uniref:spermatogenesis-associated protein 17-like isoform X2 n=1 Tax=Xenia sp. Carnegie-2017 TaxID=2897299 RepID=UPI001F04F0E7|nr:spermatogenesis-associated protein 17-like isoform X2 [Xenia sp. Carnegie-2017]
MATFIRIKLDSLSIKDALFERIREAERHRIKEHKAAIRIQSWFRGIKARSYLKFLNNCATTIQKQYRGHLDRKRYQRTVDYEVNKMREQFYNTMATTIQKRWRGYYARKYVHNYYNRKRYMEGLKEKNSIVRKELKMWRISLDREKEIKQQMVEQAKTEEFNKRHHYLVSTIQVPGIYKTRLHPELAAKEMDIKSTRLRHRPHRKCKIQNTANSTTKILNDERISLPPIGKAIQGPFRTLEEVSHQRHRPLSPTLRVQTSFTSLREGREKMKAEDWIAQVVDVPFKPFTHVEKPYSPLLHTTSKFGSVFATWSRLFPCSKNLARLIIK